MDATTKMMIIDIIQRSTITSISMSEEEHYTCKTDNGFCIRIAYTTTPRRHNPYVITLMRNNMQQRVSGYVKTDDFKQIMRACHVRYANQKRR